MSDDMWWETQPKAGWDEFVRARSRFLAQLWPERAIARDATADEGTIHAGEAGATAGGRASARLT